MRHLSILFAVLLCSAPAFAQSPDQPPTREKTPEFPPDAVETEDARVPSEKSEPPEPISTEERQTLSFFLLGNLRGRLVDIGCRADTPVENHGLHYARQVAHFRALADGAASPAEIPVALNLGDSTFPGALARYLLSSDEGAADFAATLDQIPFEAHALGDADLGMEREQLLNFVEGAGQAELPLQAANLACNAEGGAEVICEAVGTGPNGKPWQIVERDGLDIALISAVDPDIEKTIAKSRTAGLDFLAPAEMLPGLIEKIEQSDSPDLIVVLYHLTGSSETSEAVELATKVEGIDVIFTNRLLRVPDKTADTYQSGYLVAPSTGTYIVGADTGHSKALSVEFELSRPDAKSSWRARSIETRTEKSAALEPHARTSRMLRDLAGLYCEDWGEPINKGLPLAAPFSREDLQQFILNVMRFSTDSEIALVNAGTFADPGIFPIEDKLTLSDIFTFVPYNNRVVTVEVEGSVLAGLAGKLGDQAVAAGLTKKGDKVLVNGRAIQSGRTYQVATHNFVATGGDNLIAPAKIQKKKMYKPAWSEGAPSLGILAAEYVRTAAFEEDAQTTDQLAATDSFPDLYRKFLWTYTGSLNTSYNEVSVNNPGDQYDQSQLTVNSTTQINLEGNGEIRANSRNHGWNNRLLVQYAQAQLKPDQNGESDFEETKDLIRLRTDYQYKGFRADLGGEWYVPMPFAELQVESEFSKPKEREWHKVETTGIGGAKFQLFGPLEVKLGANARRDWNQPDAETTYGLNAGYTFVRTDLVEVLDKPIQFESELEYFWNDPGSSDIHELRNSNRLYFALMDQLFFTTTFQAFLFRTGQVGEFGSNTELTVGLNYLWDQTVQSF